MDNKVQRVHFSARLGIAYVFIYHGLIPKILWLAPMEQRLMELNGLGDSAYLISPAAGVMEIVLGFAIIYLRSSLIPVYVVAGMLTVLLIDVAIVWPAVLFEAFNPVSTNLMGLLLCYIVFVTQPDKKSFR